MSNENRPSNFRDRIPSVAELLDNPSVRILAERWNRSAVLSGVRSFLEEIRSDLSRRGGEAHWPALRELAERAARHIVESHSSADRPAINATGRLWGSPWIARPQGNAALERAITISREFVASPARESANASAPARDVELLICRLTGAEAAVVVHSYAGALWLSLASLAVGREVIVARGELGEVESGCALSKLIASSGALLREVGATNRTTAADYAAALNDSTAAVLSISQENFCITGDAAATELNELAAAISEHNSAWISATGLGPIVDLPADIDWPDRSLRASIAAGAQLVICRGDGLVGGPPCGILAGRHAEIRRIVEHPMFAAYQLDANRTAALAATLQGHCDPSGGEFGVPILHLLTTPLENLRNRAERLAPQLAHVEGIRSADVVSLVSQCDGLPHSNRTLRSYGIALTPSHSDVKTLERQLAAAPLPVFGRADGDRVLLDLRTVLPRHDQAIVRALAGKSASTFTADESSSPGGQSSAAVN